MVRVEWVPIPKERRRAAEPSEADISKSITDWLKLKKIFHFRGNTGVAKMSNKKKDGTDSEERYVRFGVKGCPDILGIKSVHFGGGYAIGHFFGIEVKKRTGKQSDNQKEFQRRFEEAGGSYILARSLDDVVKKLS